MKKEDCKDCYPFEERAAIIEFMGRIDKPEAEKLARAEVCKNCECSQENLFK